MPTSDVFVHERAIVEPGARMGAGSRVWAFAHVLGGARVGRDCNLCDGVFVENDVTIGDRVTVKCGVQVWDGVRLEDDVFVGPNVTFTNDLFPRSKVYPAAFTPTRVCRGASLGANATILAGVVIGRYAMVGAGAVVTKDVPPYAVVVGNPAVVRGIAGVRPVRAGAERAEGSPGGVHVLAARRGDDPDAPLDLDLPFAARRLAPLPLAPREFRAEHALRTLERVFACAAGSAKLVLDDGRAREVLELCAGDAVRVGPLVWVAHFDHSPDAALVVLSSGPVGPEERIADYEAFVSEVARSAPAAAGPGEGPR
jgi:acetyltransferase-like isoleucine patch superfamily enzyme